ncbi:MAG TPA: 16S rRNA (guanine(966)-N(2))-methyltransferase RsmD [Brevefilum sp.]|nr:16S rRNA (guanine(966)-N(2))-methyltransferase RsmD [Brevefilum sp.]HOR18284.1 16S rRNA (guanine(966)-N(2))-methyltransferase RsmD [Brevefilum sp.]
MRVIAGSAKGVKLLSVPGKTTRPITDQVKEALFNIIGVDMEGKLFLDLFGGTGAVGIEALSRGAEHAVFLDINYRAVKIIEENLRITQLHPYATVLKKDAFAFLRKLPKQGFDFVYIAPPQYRSIWAKTMQTLDENPGWVRLGETAIIQIHPKEFVEDINYTNFSEFDRRIYGDTMLIFYERTLSE